MSITLRQLRSVDALARHGHFGRAAEATSISQPALSVQIRDLEAHLGAPLFERGPRGATLTAFGASVAERARAVLRGVDEIAEMGRAEAGMHRLRLGAIPTIAPYLVPRAIRSLRARWPDLDIELRETMTRTLIADLAAGSIDAAIVALPVSEPSLEEVPLFEEPFVLVRPEGEDGPAPAPAELARMRLLLLEEGHCFRDQALSVCSVGPGRARPGLDGTTLATLVQMVAAGLGVTLIPRMAVEVETRGAAVTLTELAPPGPSRRVGMIWRRRTPLAGYLREVAEAIRAAA